MHDTKHQDNHNNIDATQSEYDGHYEGEGLESDKDRNRLERRRRRMEKWEQTWNKRTDARTRLTFGESIADASFSSASLSSHRLNENSAGEYDDDNTSQAVEIRFQWLLTAACTITTLLTIISAFD